MILQRFYQSHIPLCNLFPHYGMPHHNLQLYLIWWKIYLYVLHLHYQINRGAPPLHTKSFQPQTLYFQDHHDAYHIYTSPLSMHVQCFP